MFSGSYKAYAEEDHGQGAGLAALTGFGLGLIGMVLLTTTPPSRRRTDNTNSSGCPLQQRLRVSLYALQAGLGVFLTGAGGMGNAGLYIFGLALFHEVVETRRSAATPKRNTAPASMPVSPHRDSRQLDLKSAADHDSEW